MKSTIEKINGKWTVNGKSINELSIHEIGMLNAFFADWKQTTDDRCKKFCLDKAKELIVNDPIVLPTNMFDEAFNNPIEQIDNFLNK